MKKRHLALPLFGMSALLIYFGLFNHKPFVDFVFEFGDTKVEGEFDSTNSNVAFGETLTEHRQISYGSNILQPSGISINNDRMLIVTDTSDVFLTDADGSIIDSARLRGGPLLLRQGYSEGVTWTSDTTAAVIAGEGSDLVLLTVENDNVSVDKPISLELDNPAGSEVQAIGFDSDTKQISLTLAEPDMLRTIWLDHRGSVVGEDSFDLAGVDPEVQDVQGSDIRDGSLFLLLKRNVLVEIDLTTHEVTVAGLAFDGDTSGMALGDGELFVVTDHEFYDDQPPLRTFSLNR